jgi:hypothetical protein
MPALTTFKLSRVSFCTSGSSLLGGIVSLVGSLIVGVHPFAFYFLPVQGRLDFESNYSVQS